LYARPDSIARIDWRASARCGELVVRERARSTAISWSAIVDDSPSMRAGRRPLPLAEAEDAAAAWRGCAGSGDAWLGVRYSANVLQHSLHAALRVLPPHCALLWVSDFYDLPKTPRAVLQLCAKRFDCTALVVSDIWANALPGCLLRVTDAESGRSFPVRIGSAQRLRYARAAAAREETAAAHLRACGWQAARFKRGCAADTLLRAFGLA